jgi:hypothetical protein
LQFTRVNSDPDETDGLLGVIDKVGLNPMEGGVVFYQVFSSFLLYSVQ